MGQFQNMMCKRICVSQFQTQLEKKIKNDSMKRLEMSKFEQWANKKDRIAFTLTFSAFILFIIFYFFICSAVN
jgi:hypothetical protein